MSMCRDSNIFKKLYFIGTSRRKQEVGHEFRRFQTRQRKAVIRNNPKYVEEMLRYVYTNSIDTRRTYVHTYVPVLR